MSKTKDCFLPIRIFHSLRDRLDRARAKDGRSRTNAMERAIELYIADVEFRTRKDR